VLAALTTKFPDLRKQLFSDEGKLRSFVNVYLNDEDIRYLKKDATAVATETRCRLCRVLQVGLVGQAFWPAAAFPRGFKSRAGARLRLGRPHHLRIFTRCVMATNYCAAG